MKGQSEVTETLTIIGIIVILLILVPFILPIIQETITSYALDSPDIISKDLASLISITSASPKNIMIEYNTPAGKEYDIKLENRMLKVSNEKKEVSTPILIDADGYFTNVKDFTIEKKIEGNLAKYYINNEIIFETTMS